MILHDRDPGCRAACPPPPVAGSVRRVTAAPRTRAPQHPIGRIPVLEVRPCVDDGARPAKAVVDEEFTVTATVFREGHDAVNASVVLTDPTGAEHVQPMVCTNPGLNTWAARVSAPTAGWWTYRVEGWSDPYGTWEHDATIKVQADVDTELMLEEGALVIERALDEVPPHRGAAGRALRRRRSGLRDTKRPAAVRLKAGTDGSVERELAARPLREYVSPSADLPLLVERELALSGAWYELFPRSEGATYDEKEHRWTTGTLRTAAKRLPAIAAMGFDVVYLTPVHPIGPGGQEGPEQHPRRPPRGPRQPLRDRLGRRRPRRHPPRPRAPSRTSTPSWPSRRRLGMEVAMDLALQCSPDHPWVKTHPEWFTTRADGTIAYAENPPKKYQDIYPLNFDNDPAGIYAAVRAVVQVWIDHGVTLFRVDNPHTKPVEFWQWLIADVAKDHPEVIWLAEAFTQPAMMHTLGKVGFQQSYTYYTWRNSAYDLREYLTELSGDAAAYMRPSFWPTTHDILTPYMQFGGPAAWKLRAVLAATLVPTYGIYSGYELMEHVARPGAEEQIDNEKYEYKNRHWADYEPGGSKAGRSLAGWLTMINDIRRAHPALHRLRDIRFHHVDDENFLAFSKRRRLPDGTDDVVVVVANLDPHSTRATTLRLDMAALGLELGRHLRGARAGHRRAVDLAARQLRPARAGGRTRARRRRQEALVTAILGMGHSTPGLGANQPGLRHDPEWFRTAVFYEVLVRAFGDSTGSGEGDFAGIVNRLDYLQWLGVDCLWLPPFYASPLRDGGYDISDYTQVLPEFGTLPEFRELITQAHARGIRIITDFVMNHTSDQHPWFQASRSDPDGPYGDFYVWSDTDDKYTDARVIFVDTETSNWTFDPIRRQFFWHRFFSHQPDLNFENPKVHEAMYDIVRFWMDMGIDGFRLDAVPYLFEEEGHNGENHPRTHEFLAELRAMVDTEYPGPDPARRGQPAARATSSTTSAPRSRRSARCASTSR